MSLQNIIKEIYAQDGTTFKYHIVSGCISTAINSLAANYIDNKGYDPAVNSTITTFLGAASYWSLFIGLTARNEKDEMKQDDGTYDGKKIYSKSAQYLSFIGIGEFVYSTMRGITQYHIQQNLDLDAWSASLLTDACCMVAYGIVVPPIRYMLRKMDRLFGIKRKNDR